MNSALWLTISVLGFHLKELSSFEYPPEIDLCLKKKRIRLKDSIEEFKEAFDLWKAYNFELERSNNGTSAAYPLSDTDDECGTLSEEFQPIVGGKEAPDYAWPWLAKVKLGPNGCGGIVIAKQWVLTAAHCLNKKPTPVDAVYLGREVRPNAQDELLHKYSIAERFTHENYTNFKGDLILHDVALLKLTSSVTYDSRVRPACLPAPFEELTSPLLHCFIAGYGQDDIRDNRPSGKRLNELKVTVLSFSECKGFWDYQVTKDHVCVRAPLGKTASSCSGDSGGPLMCQTLGNQFVVVGVSSFIAGGCLHPTLPDVYVKLDHYLPWIRETIKSDTGSLPEELTAQDVSLLQ